MNHAALFLLAAEETSGPYIHEFLQFDLHFDNLCFNNLYFNNLSSDSGGKDSAYNSSNLSL